MRVTVVGLGKIGLPLAVQIAGKGHHVIGLDISGDVIATVLSGAAPFPGEPELEDRIRGCLSDETFTATTDPAVAMSGSQVTVVVVPLVVDASRRPDYTALDAATAAISGHLAPGALVSYETTLPLGTTRDRFAPTLAQVSGLALGVDLFVCHSPERVSSGSVFSDLRAYPKLVGGIDAESAGRAVAFYESALDFDERPDLPRPNGVWDLGSAEAAELAKLAETTYRDVNIAYANELAAIAEDRGLDVWSVIEACNSQPFSHIHQPGIAVGGHCIPVYPHFLLAGAPEARLPQTAREINASMVERCISRLEAHLGGSLKEKTVVVLGVAYRPGVKESAFSGAFDIVRELKKRGAVVTVHDPMYTQAELAMLGLTMHVSGQAALAAVLHTAHDTYTTADLAELVPGLAVVFDGRGVLESPRDPRVILVRLGDGDHGQQDSLALRS